jgi:hypothetical protein
VTLNTVSLYCLFFSPPVSGNPDDSLTISSLLLPTCKVREEDSSHHQIGPLPIGFILPLLRCDNFIMFNLVFSFLLFFYIASRFLWSRYSYDRSVKCLWVLCRFKRDQYSRVASYFFKISMITFRRHWYIKQTIKKPYGIDDVRWGSDMSVQTVGI